MNSRFLFWFGLALCATVSAATYLGTRTVLDQIRHEDTGRSQTIRRLEEKLAALERSDGAIERRVQALASVRSFPRGSGGVADPVAAREAGQADSAASPEPASTLSPESPPGVELYPGAVIDDWKLLNDAERNFLERHPPDGLSIIVRGPDGMLGSLRISAKRDGRRTDIALDDSNFGLVEELSTAIVDLDAARRAAMLDLAASGAGTDCATGAEASERGNEIGSYFVLPVGERFRVFAADEIARDRRVAAAEALLDRIKRDFGEYTSYVLNWTRPTLDTP